MPKTHNCDNCHAELGKKSAYTSHFTSLGIILICKACVDKEKAAKKEELEKAQS